MSLEHVIVLRTEHISRHLLKKNVTTHVWVKSPTFCTSSTRLVSRYIFERLSLIKYLLGNYLLLSKYIYCKNNKNKFFKLYRDHCLQYKFYSYFIDEKCGRRPLDFPFSIVICLYHTLSLYE